MSLEEENAKHIEILNHNSTAMQIDMGIIKNDIVWIKKHLWSLWIPIVLLLLGVGIQLIK